MTDSHIIDRIRKVLALAENGVGGEKDNAQRILQQLLSKYNISMADVVAEKQDRVKMPYKYLNKHHKDLLLYCVATVTNNTVRSFRFRMGHKKEILFNLTAGDHLEVAAMYEYYKKLWDDELKIFYQAFIGKHQLGALGNSKAEPKCSTEELEKLIAFYRGMKDSGYVSTKKQLQEAVQ